MNRPSMPDPGQIVRLTTAFWDSQSLLTASRLKLFDQLAGGARTAEQVAGALGLDVRMTGLLLRVLAGLGLLEFRDGVFANSAAASAFLVSTSPAYMGNAMRYSDQLYATWGRLDEALRSGKPALAAESYLGDDEARTLDSSSQYLYDADGRKYETSSAIFTLPDYDKAFLQNINPGNTVTDAPLLYDVPDGFVPTSIELHDSPFSGGVTVALG